MYHIEPIMIVLKNPSAEARARAEHVARMVRGEIVTSDEPDRLRLVVSDDRTSLYGPKALSLGGVSVDFSHLDLRPGSGNLSRRQPLARAIGPKAESVIDATAGMGQDALLLACMGYDVLAIERSPVVAALLEDGVRRADADERISRAIGGRLRVIHGDARHVVNELERPDVVYVDPMFPPKRRASALPKKEIQLLRLVVGDDEDADELLKVALRTAKQRVVVKRPTHAPPLATATMSIKGKLVRYDVYVVNK